jgi:hypothetical protein
MSSSNNSSREPLLICGTQTPLSWRFHNFDMTSNSLQHLSRLEGHGTMQLAIQTNNVEQTTPNSSWTHPFSLHFLPPSPHTFASLPYKHPAQRLAQSTTIPSSSSAVRHAIHTTTFHKTNMIRTANARPPLRPPPYLRRRPRYSSTRQMRSLPCRLRRKGRGQILRRVANPGDCPSGRFGCSERGCGYSCDRSVVEENAGI